MHPVLFSLGSFEVGTYGLMLAVGFFLALALAKRLGKGDGLPAEAMTDLAITVLLAGIVGAKVLMVIVDLANGVPASQAFSLSTLRAGGAVHGGVVAGAAAFFWRMKKHHLPYAETMDALTPPLALAQGIGRLGCFSAGCCYGTECHAPWAVTFTDPAALRFSGTPLFQALHPVQIYTSLMNLAVFGILLLLHRKRPRKGSVFGAYFVLEGLGRSIMETWRGDPDRGVWFGQAWLSTGRLSGFLFILFGIGVLVWAFRRKAAEA
ncbi:MAG: prolipoprotein diacylglyceryl transferase [Acidobacteria bacterium]|nr:prolipoprotein diacylglyceryl transferase [Acidobacteriota bacterium]